VSPLFPLLFVLDVAVGPSLVVVVVALVAGVCRVLEQHAAGARPDGLNELNGELGVVLEALVVRLDVALATGVHDLGRGDTCHKRAEGRP
jgi:hypothetical protein